MVVRLTGVCHAILSHRKLTSSSFHKWFGSNFTVLGQMIKIPSGSLLPQRSLSLRPLSLCAGKPNWTRSDTIVILVDLKFYFSRVIPCPWECLWVEILKTVAFRKVSKWARSLVLPSSSKSLFLFLQTYRTSTRPSSSPLTQWLFQTAWSVFITYTFK